MRSLLWLLTAFAFAGCMTSESQVKEAVKKNPKIIFDVIEENPEAFIEAVNKAARMAQMNQYQKQMESMNKERDEDLKNPKKPALDKSRRLSGSDAGKIVIVEYADFQCPACKMGHGPLAAFKKKYIDQVQFYFKNMPLDMHPEAMPASKYFEAIRMQDASKAYKFYDYLFQNQKSMTEKDFFKKAVKAVGADLKKVEADMNSEKVLNIISADMEEFQKFGYSGTPVILMNGVALQGAQSLENLEAMMKQLQK